MLIIVFFTLLALFFLSVPGFNAAIAEDSAPGCIQLDEKASGDMAKYSLYGEANGQVFFSGISCAIEHRNKELCAMEMISFDTTAKVYDYNTAEEIDIGKAYFCLDEKNKDAPIVAFGSKDVAENYSAEIDGNVVLDYTELTDRMVLKSSFLRLPAHAVPGVPVHFFLPRLLIHREIHPGRVCLHIS